MSDYRYAIELSSSGFWVFPGIPTSAALGPNVFSTSDAGKRECAVRNLARAVAEKFADTPMEWRGLKSPPIYRKFYEEEIQRYS